MKIVYDRNEWKAVEGAAKPLKEFVMPNEEDKCKWCTRDVYKHAIVSVSLVGRRRMWYERLTTCML